jgi:hypothetical protein
MSAQHYRIFASLPSGMCQPYYEGKVDVFARSEEDAIAKAKTEIRKVHGNREIKIKSCEVI